MTVKEKTMGLSRFSPSNVFAGIGRAKPNAASPDEIDPDRKDDDDEDEEEEGEDDDKKKKKKSKKTKTSDDGNDDDGDDEANEDDEKDEDDPNARATRGRERSRISAIVNSAAGKKAPGAALGLALETSMPRKAAIRVLGRMDNGAAGRGSLHDRMAGLQTPPIGPGAGETPDIRDPKALAAAIIRADAKARGEVD